MINVEINHIINYMKILTLGIGFWVDKGLENNLKR